MKTPTPLITSLSSSMGCRTTWSPTPRLRRIDGRDRRERQAVLARRHLLGSPPPGADAYGARTAFMLAWPFFKSRRSAVVAACVPARNDAQVCPRRPRNPRHRGLPSTPCQGAAARREELLRGPLLYGIVFVVSTALWFRELPASIALLGEALCFEMALPTSRAVAGVKATSYRGAPESRGPARRLPRASRALVALASAARWPSIVADGVRSPRWNTRCRCSSHLPWSVCVESLPMKDVDNILVLFAVAGASRPWSPAESLTHTADDDRIVKPISLECVCAVLYRPCYAASAEKRREALNLSVVPARRHLPGEQHVMTRRTACALRTLVVVLQRW